MEVNWFKFRAILLGLLLFSSLIFGGCIEEKNENETDTKKIDDNYVNLILGTWVRNETFENFTYIIEYKFFSNNSFFSGVKDEGNDNYNVSIWGTFNIDIEEIQLIVGGDTPSESVHKYFISPEGDSLLLYYEDGINYDILSKEK